MTTPLHPADHVFSDGTVIDAHEHRRNWNHVYGELYRYFGNEITTAEVNKHLQGFYRAGKDPQNFVLIEETVAAKHYPWETRFIFKWVRLPKNG